MRYMVERNFVRVWGYIWMPNTLAAYEYTLSPYDVENIGESVSAMRHNRHVDIDSLDNGCGSVHARPHSLISRSVIGLPFGPRVGG